MLEGVGHQFFFVFQNPAEMPQPVKPCCPDRFADASAEGVHIPPWAQTGRLATLSSKGLAATPPSSLRRRTLSPEACSFAASLSEAFLT